MSDNQLVVNRDLLCVTPHEDEGYLSPSEEDLKRSFASRSGFLNCRPPNSLRIHCGFKVVDESESDAEDQIPWEELARLPQSEEEHLSWDRLKLPVPQRFHSEQRSCLRQIRKSPANLYITDDSKNHALVTEKMWRVLDPLGSPTPGPGGDNAGFGQEALQKILSKPEEPTSVSPKLFIQHIFHLICGRESLSFSRLIGDRYMFVKNAKVLVNGMSPGLVANLSEEFLVSGKIYKRLTRLSALHYDEKLMVKEGFGRNAVITAFLKFISDYLKFYQTAMMLKSTSIATFSALTIFYKPFRHQLLTLDKMVDLYLATDQIKLLKGLNSMMLSTEIPYIADLLRSAFITCAAAYLRYVADWIFRGDLTKGFHIQKTKSYDYQDRRFWVKQFSQVPSIPKFLEAGVNLIFETGKAINLLNIIRNTQPRTSLLSCILQDEGATIHPAVEFPQVTLLAREWQIKLESFFEEYSFLQDDVASALNRSFVEEKETTNIDFDTIEDAKKSFEIKRSDHRQKIQDEKLEKQRSLYNMLTQQIVEKRDRKKQETETAIQEDEKIASYINAVDQRHLNEEIRLMKKHFGERIGRVEETVGLRNVKKRIAATNWTHQDGDKNVDHIKLKDSGWDRNDGAEIMEEDEKIYIPKREKEDIINMTVSCSNGSEEIVHSFNDPLNSTNESSTSNQSFAQLNRTTDSEISNENIRGEYANKFDATRLKVRPVVPYKTTLDLCPSGFVRLPRSLLSPNTTITLSDQEIVDQERHILRHDSFFLNFFFQQSALIPVEAQNRMVNSALLHYFIVEMKLFQHIEALNNYLCLQNGLFGHFLTTYLVKEVKKGALPSKNDISHRATGLNEILSEAISLSAEGNDGIEIRDNLGFILIRENNRKSVDLDSQKHGRSSFIQSNYELLDELTLNYSVEWPLSILLTDDLLIHYEQLFTYLMKLYRAELLLMEMYKVLKFKGKASNQLAMLHHYRYRMLHFVRSVRHYINVTVIHCAWTELVTSFPELNSLDKLYERLVRHIKFITTNCLLGTKGEAVKKLLVDQLTVIECFCTEVESSSSGISWDAEEEIPIRRFQKLSRIFNVWEEIQKVFINVTFKLAERGTYPKVPYFLELFNFNQYFGKKSSST